MNNLPLAALILGIVITAKHLISLVAPGSLQNFLKKFPRSRFWGTTLLLIATIWTFFLTATIDLGEFSSLRMMLMVGIIFGSALFWHFVPEFLAVRSLGFILLLLARPMLEMTFLKSGLLPILLSLLAYLWIIAGLFMVGMPYLLRDFITFISTPHRKQLWQLLSYAGLFYGLLLVIEGGLQLLS